MPIVMAASITVTSKRCPDLDGSIGDLILRCDERRSNKAGAYRLDLRTPLKLEAHRPSSRTMLLPLLIFPVSYHARALAMMILL